MKEKIIEYGLDEHCSAILQEYRDNRPVFEKMLTIVRSKLEESIRECGLYIAAVEARIKAEDSLAGKLEKKGYKYGSLSDITDILGLRIITFYTDEVDKVAALVDRLFDVDWENSVDKRKMHKLDSFGYQSLHYVCRIPASLHREDGCPELNEIRFEIQMRTALQHVWSTLDHDTGYKSGVDVPREYLRSMNCLAGMLELADEQFSQIRTNINNYRRQVQSLVSSGNFSEVQLNSDSYGSYLNLKPFDKLARKIAAINQAEIQEVSLDVYLDVFRDFHFETLGDLDNFIKENSEDAFKLSSFQLGNTDLDIISSSIAVQNLCVVHCLKTGGGLTGLKRMFDIVYGCHESNLESARRVVETARQLPFFKETI